MIFIAAFFAMLWLYTICGRPPVIAPPDPMAPPTWRCTLRGRKVILVDAHTEGQALKLLLAQKVDLGKIESLEIV